MSSDKPVAETTVCGSTPPGKAGWYAGIYDWKGEEYRGAFHWDGKAWSFDHPENKQPAPLVLRYAPRRYSEIFYAVANAFPREDAA